MPPKRQDAKAMQRNKVFQFEKSPKKLTGPSRKTPRDLNREEKRQLLVATVRREKKERIKKNQKPVGTRYRRTKRLRPCVFHLIFLVSLGIILLERYLGSLFKLEDFKHAYYDHLGIDPWQAETPARARVSTVRPILELTAPSEISSCGMKLRWIDNVHNPKSHSTRYRKIPMVVHQTSQSRCLTRNFERAARQWATLPGWSYYFHDDSAVDNLLESDFPEFPHLKLVLSRCLDSHSARLDLWRYLVLWEYVSKQFVGKINRTFKRLDLVSFPQQNKPRGQAFVTLNQASISTSLFFLTLLSCCVHWSTGWIVH